MRILITAGPTREPIDPVRYLSNLSSGKMGYALAAAAVAAGHEVTLVSGPVCLPAPEPAVERLVRIETALEMQAAVHVALPGVDAVIMCAAVADFRAAEVSPGKLKKQALLASGGDTWELRLVRNPDILAGLRDLARPGTVLVGFAAETDAGLEQAWRKLAAKRCDLLALNDVSAPGLGFGADENEVTLLFAGGQILHLSRASKLEIARGILAQVTQLHAARQV